MENNYIKIKGLGSIVLKGEKPKPKVEYLISIRAELAEIKKNIQDSENPFYTFIFEYLTTELIQEIGSAQKLEVQKGKSLSQIFRFACRDVARKMGIDTEDYYKERMSEIIKAEEEKLT